MIYITTDEIAAQLSGAFATDEEKQRAAALALFWLENHISSSEYLETDKAKNLAEAMGQYYLAIITADDDESVKVGDITIRSDSMKLICTEEKLKNDMLCQCADILKDGEFFFGSC